MFNDMDRPHTKNQSVSQKEDYDKYGLSSLIKWIDSKVWTGQRLSLSIVLNEKSHKKCKHEETFIENDYSSNR